MRWTLLLLLTGCVAPPVQEEPADDPPPAIVEPDRGTFVPEGYDPSLVQRVMFLGDSITEGTGASSGTLRYRNLLVANDDTWPDYTDRDLTNLAPDLLDVHSVARGGATTASMVRYQLDDIAEAVGETVEGPSLAVLTIGGNDMQLALASFLAQGEEFAQERLDLLLENLDITIDALTDADRFPDGTEVFLANVYDPSDGVGQVNSCFGGLELYDMLVLLDETNLAIRQLAEERGVAMVDLHGHFAGHGFYSDDPESPAYDAEDPTRWLNDDCIHPTDRGHHELRRLFLGAMEGELIPR